MPQNSTAQLVKEQLSKQQSFVVPKLTTALDEKTKDVLKTLGFKDIDPVKFDHLAHDIAQTASLDVIDNIGRIYDFSASSSVIADSITQSLLAHPLTHTQAMQMNEPKIYSTTLKIIGDPAKILPRSNLENVIVLSNMENLTVLERPTTELQAKITEEVDRHVQEKSPLAHPSVNNTLKENALEMVNTYTETLNNKTKILLEKGEIPTLAELNNLKTETFNTAAAKISINTSTFKDKVEPAELADRLSYVLDLKPLDQKQTETLGLGTAEPGILTFTKGTGASGFTVGFGIANNQAAQVGAYNSLLVYDKDWLEKTSSKQIKIIEAAKEKADATPREIINANYAQKKLDILQNARTYQSQNPKLVEAYQEYFQSRPVGSRLYVSSQAAQNTTTANFNEYRGAYTPRSLSTNTGSLAQRTFGGLAFKFGGAKLGSLSKVTKLGKGLATKADVPMMIASATRKLMKKMAVVTTLGLGAVGLYFMKLGAAALKGFIIGAAIGGTVGTGAGIALGLAIAAPFGPFAPLVAAFTVPAGAIIGFTVGATIGGVTGGLIAYGLASGSATAVSMGVGTGIGGTIGAYIGFTVGSSIAAGFITFAAAACAATLIGCLLVPVAAVSAPVIVFVSTVAFTYIGAAIGAGIGYVVGEYIIDPVGNFLGAAGSGIAGGGSTIGSAISGLGGFLTSAGSSILGAISNAAGGFLSGAGHIASALWNGMTSFSFSGSAIATPILTGIGTVASVAVGAQIVTATSFFNNGVDNLNPADVQKPPENVTNYASASKVVSIPGLGLGPSSFLQIANNQLGQDLTYNIKIKATANISSIVCEDRAALVKTDLSVVDLPAPPIPQTPLNCPSQLNDGQEYNYSFSMNTPSSAEYQDAVIFNRITVSGSAETIGNVGGLGFWVPLHDLTMDQTKINDTKNLALTNYPNNLINAQCPGGLSCWDYVINTSRAANINPTFILAVWGEESHYSDVGNHFSCPVSLTRSHDGTGVSGSLSCFLNQIIDSVPNTADGFIEAMNHYCGTGPWSQDPVNDPQPVCSNNPNFFTNLQSIFTQLGGAAQPLSGGGAGTPTPFSLTSVATLKIGTPATNPTDPSGWPTCGTIDQGPWTTPPQSHSDPGFRSSVDIGNTEGTKIYTTHSGTVTYIGADSYGGLYVALRGDRYISYYVHLVSFNPDLSVNQQVAAGTFVGLMDHTGIANYDHLHYMIRNIDNVEIPAAEFNSLIPGYQLHDSVTSSWGPC